MVNEVVIFLGVIVALLTIISISLTIYATFFKGVKGKIDTENRLTNNEDALKRHEAEDKIRNEQDSEDHQKINDSLINLNLQGVEHTTQLRQLIKSVDRLSKLERK